MNLIGPKYKIVHYTVGKTEHEYGISKRFLCFFYRKLCHHKIVQWEGGSSTPSYEILTFPTPDKAAFEIDKLTYGAGRITQRYIQAASEDEPDSASGKCVRTIRGK